MPKDKPLKLMLTPPLPRKTKPPKEAGVSAPHKPPKALRLTQT